MARYRKDYLTRRKGSDNWILQFRVPERLRGRPPFGHKSTFYRSLKTANHSEAVKRRDAFFASVGWHDEELERQERESNKRKDGHDHYWEALTASLSGRSKQELEGEIEIVVDQLADVNDDIDRLAQKNPDAEPSPVLVKRLEKYKAQKKALDRALQEIVTGTSEPIEEPHAFEITIKRAFTIYKKKMEARKRTPKTIARMWPAYDRFVKFLNGRDMPLVRVHRPHVSRFIEHYQEKGLAKATIQNDLSYFIGCFRYLQDSGYISGVVNNPFENHSLADFDEGGSREIYTTEQLVQLVRAMPDDQEVQALLYMGYYTGMRLEEVFTARHATVSDTSVFLVAEKGTGKTKAATRTIPVHPELEVALKQLGYLPKAGERLPWATKTSDALGKRFGRVKKAVLEAEGAADHSNRYTFHSLRHGFATNLNAVGFPELHLAELTGHSKGSAGRTEAGKTYIKGLPITRLVEMIQSLPTIPLPKAVDA